jgi:RNA recognition motif-containing protein
VNQEFLWAPEAIHMMWIPFLIIICYKIKNELKKMMLNYDEDSMTGKAADYTLFLSGLPTDMSEEKLLSLIENYGRNVNIKPIEISCVYDMNRVYDLYEKKKYIESELAVANYHNLESWRFNPFMLMVKKKPFVRSIKHLEFKLQNIMSLLHLYEEKEFNMYKRTKYGFITFNTIQEKEKYAKIIKSCTTFHIYKDTPEPEEIVWKNISFPRYKRFSLILVSVLLGILLMAICAAINTALTLFQVVI